MNLQEVVNHRFPESRSTYTFKDTILYALGVGFGAEPLEPNHLRFLYEEGLVAAPTMANILGHPGFWARDPRYGIDWRKLLHAEQRLVIHSTLPVAGNVIARHDVLGVRDRGATGGAFLYLRKVISDETGEDLCTVVSTSLLRGSGGCGDFGEAPPELQKLPTGEPASVMEVRTLEISPLIYRLSGDLNPLHIDPNVARDAGFPRPILHGLCTKGFAGYALLKAFCNFDPARLRSMAVRFTRPVIPGERIRFEFWRPSAGLVRFRGLVPERNEIVVDRGTADIGN